MPPVRTPKKNSSAAKSSTLLAYGFGRPNKERKTTDTEAVTNETLDSQAAAGPPVGLARPTTTILNEAVTNETVDGKAIAGASVSLASPTTTVPERILPLRLSKGVRNAQFNDDRFDWNEKYHQKIGTSTRAITFESYFVLSNTHIDQILAMGPRVCGNLADFIFIYEDVAYNAHNDASSLTDETIVRLAKACPKLKKVQLQCATGLTDETLLAFLRYRPNLTSLEITGRNSRPEFSGAPLEALEKEPNWVPNLKMLILTSEKENRKFMKAMRSLTRARIGLTIRLVSVSELKKWGD